jgi:hypothetical protein
MASDFEFELLEDRTTPVFYGDPRPSIRPWTLGFAEVDSLRRNVIVVIGPAQTLPIIGVNFLLAFGLQLVADPTNNLLALIPAPPRVG